MLITRVVTAVILIAVVMGSLAWSPTAFAIVATVVLGFALAEWLQLTGASRKVSMTLAAIVGVVLLYVAIASRDVIAVVAFPLSVLACALWLVITAVLMQPNAIALRAPRGLGIALALLLVLAAWFALVSLLFQGAIVLLSVLLIVWIADTAAYFAGRAFGHRKLAPHISPGKTWAGVIGAVGAVLITAMLVKQFAPAAPIYSNGLFSAGGAVLALLLMAGLVVLSVAGDLYESLLKRQAGVKDSSQLLPGHGGVLDRVDAMVPVLPAAFLVQWLVR
ncbi:MAG: phosphatidate cytidylyltransferase [Burkholderiaceae bacterium]